MPSTPPSLSSLCLTTFSNMALWTALGEEEPLLRCNKEYRRRTTGRYYQLCILTSVLVAAIIIFMAVLALISCKTPNTHEPSPSTPPRRHHDTPRSFPQNLTLNYTRNETFDFDPEGGRHNYRSIGVWERLDRCHYRWNASGQVTFARGDEQQQQMFVAVAEIAASSKMALDSVQVSMRNDRHHLIVDCAEFSAGGDGNSANRTWDVAVRVDLTVFVKPHQRQFFSTDVHTNVLEVMMDKLLDFPTQSVSISSRQGDIACRETETFFPRKLTLRTSNGAITGNWTLTGEIDLSTGESYGYPSANKPIDINLPPVHLSYGRQARGAIRARSDGGDINIRMPLEPSELGFMSMSVDIHSQSGQISGTFQQGLRTVMTTRNNGTINATLLPYFTYLETSTILTSTDAGDTFVHVLPPVVERGIFGRNPLLNTKSEHVSTSGNLELQYPPEWAGTALGVSDAGDVRVAKEGYDHVFEDQYLVVARKGTGMGSLLDFKTHNGTGGLAIV